ncbi:hypothetical protein Nepgr_024773 [Nepenthes gracilis]|uniref:Uncharacterized protein n=1 Tax=Nepenthes gracilis TaxID=150966 RepID=A0AAD3T4R0_NEPGR|nr:hypothetical protein Nepgr_024773 [Nepenthes gracilis]
MAKVPKGHQHQAQYTNHPHQGQNPTGTAVHPNQCIKSAANKTPSAQGKPAINLTGGNHHQSILQLLLFYSKFSINCGQPKVPPAPDSARTAELIHQQLSSSFCRRWIPISIGS